MSVVKPPVVKPPVLWVCGPRAVGKSVVGFDLYFGVMVGGVKSAYVDLDQISFCRPVPGGDPENHRVKARNIAAMWSTFRASGARCLVMSGRVDSRAVIDTYAAAIPDTTLTVCRLHATAETLTERIVMRGNGLGVPIPGDELKGLPADSLSRITEATIRDAAALDRDGIGDLRIDTDGWSVQEIVEAIRSATGGWPHLR